jgi:tetratricopeptide (TPR) repeat protein
MDNTLNISPEQREKVKTLYEKIDALQSEGSGHKKIFEYSQELIEILPNDSAAIQTYLVSMIKTKQFQEALSFLNKIPGSIKQSLIYEHAYILHRAGDNKEALTKLKTL